MPGYTPNYGPPGTEPEYVGSRNRGRRPARAPSPKSPAAITSTPKTRMSMRGYRPAYGPPGTEPEYVGSRNKGRHRSRAPSPKPSIDQHISTQTSALTISAKSNSPRQANPPVVLATKSLKMAKQQKAWKKAYTAQLTISNPDLPPDEVADMTHEAWQRTEPGLRQVVATTATERKVAKWRKKQMKANPRFLGQRAHRLTQLYNEVREMNPALSCENVTTQAKDLEKREVIAAAGRELLEKKEARYRAKEKMKPEDAKEEKVERDQKGAEENQISSSFARMERKQFAEHSGDEDGSGPPECFEQPQERLAAASPALRKKQEQRLRDFKVLAAHEQAQWKTAQHEVALRAEAVRGEARIDEIRRDEARKHEEQRAEALKHEARSGEARKTRVQMDEAHAAWRAEVEARREESRQAEALRREKLYQAAVKSENMKRWFQKLAQDEPEAPEEMHYMAEEMEVSDEMEDSGGMQDDSDEMQLSG